MDDTTGTEGTQRVEEQTNERPVTGGAIRGAGGRIDVRRAPREPDAKRSANFLRSRRPPWRKSGSTGVASSRATRERWRMTTPTTRCAQRCAR